MKKYVIAAVLATTVWVCLNWAFHELGTAGYIIWAIPAIVLGIITVKMYSVPAYELGSVEANPENLFSDESHRLYTDPMYSHLPSNIHYSPLD